MGLRVAADGAGRGGETSGWFEFGCCGAGMAGTVEVGCALAEMRGCAEGSEGVIVEGTGAGGW